MKREWANLGAVARIPCTGDLSEWASKLPVVDIFQMKYLGGGQLGRCGI